MRNADRKSSRRVLPVAIWMLPALALGQFSFDVTSVKRHDPKDRAFSPPVCANERFRARALPVVELLAWAYDLRADQYITLEASLPAWARTEPYDFEATVSAPVPVERCRLMVQQLLVYRF